MKTYILRAVTLYIAIIFTNVLLATGNDSLAKKELGVLFSSGSQLNLKGIYFTGGLYYSKSKTVYSLQYSYFASHYIKLNDYTGFLENTNSTAVLIGLKIPKRKFNALVNAGLNFGLGRVATYMKTKDAPWGSTEVNTYFKTGFFGPIFNCVAKYDITNKISLGLTFTTSFNYYFQYGPRSVHGITKYKYGLSYINNFSGLQLCAAIKIKY